MECELSYEQNLKQFKDKRRKKSTKISKMVWFSFNRNYSPLLITFIFILATILTQITVIKSQIEQQTIESDDDLNTLNDLQSNANKRKLQTSSSSKDKASLADLLKAKNGKYRQQKKEQQQQNQSPSDDLQPTLGPDYFVQPNYNRQLHTNLTHESNNKLSLEIAANTRNERNGRNLHGRSKLNQQSK